jgi:hypothetical protein
MEWQIRNKIVPSYSSRYLLLSPTTQLNSGMVKLPEGRRLALTPSTTLCSRLVATRQTIRQARYSFPVASLQLCELICLYASKKLVTRLILGRIKETTPSISECKWNIWKKRAFHIGMNFTLRGFWLNKCPVNAVPTARPSRSDALNMPSILQMLYQFSLVIYLSGQPMIRCKIKVYRLTH